MGLILAEMRVGFLLIRSVLSERRRATKEEWALSFHHAREAFAKILDSVSEADAPEKYQLYQGLVLLAEGLEYDFNVLKNKMQQMEIEMRKLETKI